MVQPHAPAVREGLSPFLLLTQNRTEVTVPKITQPASLAPNCILDALMFKNIRHEVGQAIVIIPKLSAQIILRLK